jgi:hypothetical protein
VAGFASSKSEAARRDRAERDAIERHGGEELNDPIPIQGGTTRARL